MMIQKLEKEIFIPRRLEKTSFKWLPLSDKLESFLAQNNLFLIGDLKQISKELINKILFDLDKPFPELRHYILAFQENNENELRLIDVECEIHQKPDELGTKSRAHQTLSIEQILSRTIFIPLPARKWLISSLPISTSLVEKLNKYRYAKLNDLNGTSYSRFVNTDWFEKQDILDLYIFITQLQSEEIFRSVAESVSEAQKRSEQAANLSSTLYVANRPNIRERLKQSANSSSAKLIQETTAINEVRKILNNKAEIIQTPASLKGLPIEHLAPSDKLKAIFKKEKMLIVGQLDGLVYSELQKRLELDESDLEELQNLVRFANRFSRYTTFKSGFDNIKKAALRRNEIENKSEISSAQSDKQPEQDTVKSNQPQENTDYPLPENSLTVKFKIPLLSDHKFVVPAYLQKTPISDFSLTIKLTGILQKLGVELIGNLDKISYKDFTQAPLCTNQAKDEFRQFLVKLENIEAQSSEQLDKPIENHLQSFDLVELMKFINGFVSELSPIDKKIFSDRLGGTNDEKILTFDAIAENIGISREKTYQSYVRNLNKLKNILPSDALEVLEKFREECILAVCPVTPKFLIKSVNTNYELFQFPVAFYIRLFGAILPQLPILPEIKNQILNLKSPAKNIEQKIANFLETQSLPTSLVEVFSQVTLYNSEKENIESDFFEAIQFVKFNLIETHKYNELFLELNCLDHIS